MVNTADAANHPQNPVDLSELVTLRKGLETTSSSFGSERLGGVRVQGDSREPATSPLGSIGFYGDIYRGLAAGRAVN